LGLFATGVEVLAASECDSANLRLLELLPELPLARTVPVESYQNWYREGSEAVRVRAEQLTQSLAESLAEEGAQRWKKVEQLLASLPAGGDPNRGMQVFRSTQAACSSCHQVAYVGGLIGPDMSRIGSTRSRRELLEAIAFPSARQEQSYRSEKFALIDGRVLGGLVEETAGDWLMLRTGPEQRVKIRRDEIEERAASDLSLMPAGIVEALTPEQLADLLAFLESRK
jgi:putative heme-binding domain-containing protein